jgi:hypothetical protein
MALMATLAWKITVLSIAKAVAMIPVAMMAIPLLLLIWMASQCKLMWSLHELSVSRSSFNYTANVLTMSTERRYTVSQLAAELGQPQLPELIRRFLYDQLYPNNPLPSSQGSLHACPKFSGRVLVFSSAMVTYYAPSDESGIDGIHREYIRATLSWRRGPARYDCALVNLDPSLDGMRGLGVVRILRFFSFVFETKTYPCAFVRWFTLNDFDEDSGMWMVQPEVSDGMPVCSVIHLDAIFRSAHLIPIYGDKPVPRTVFSHNSLDAFVAFYVNKFIDYHAFTVAS